MPRYLVLVKYTAAALQQLVSDPVDRLEAVQPVAAACGGILVRKDLVANGEFDLAAEIEMPDVGCATAFYMAVMGGGAVRDMKLLPLLSISEGMEAMHQARAAGYQFPGKPASAARAKRKSRQSGRR